MEADVSAMAVAIISRVPARIHPLILVAICAVLAGCGSASSNAPNRDATLLLDFTPNAVHAGIFSAVRRGYDEAEGAGGDPAKVHKVTIGFNAVQSLLADRVAGATAFWDVEGVAFRARRPGAREFRVDDFGAPPYPELVLTTTRRTIDDEPGLVSSTVRALVRGYNFTITDPESSAQDLLAANPGLKPAQVGAQLDVLDTAFVGAAGRFGVLDPPTLRRWAAWEARFGIVDKPPDVARMFDASFVNAAVKQAAG